MNHVIVYRSLDAIEAEVIADALRADGIDARHIGTRNAALIGVGSGVLEQRIEVSESQVGRARALIEAFLADDSATDASHGTERVPDEASEPAAGADGESVASSDASDLGDGARDGAEWARSTRGRDDDELRPRSAVLAIGAALVIPGGSHFYTRRPLGGVVVAGAFIVGVTILLVAAPGATGDRVAAAVAIAAAWLGDVIGGVRAVRRGARAGTPPSAQIVVPAVALLITVPLALLLRQQVGSGSPPETSALPVVGPHEPSVYEPYDEAFESMRVPTPLGPLDGTGLDPSNAATPTPAAGTSTVDVSVAQPVTTPRVVIGDGHWFAADSVLGVGATPSGVVAIDRYGWTTFDTDDGRPLTRTRALVPSGYVTVAGDRLVVSDPVYLAASVLDLATGQPTDLGARYPSVAGISPDGRVVALLELDRIHVIEGDAERALKQGFRGVKRVLVGNDGAVVVLTDTEVFVVAPDGSFERVLLECATGAVGPEVVVLRGCAPGLTVAFDRRLRQLWQLETMGTALAFDPVDGALVLADTGHVRWIDASTGALLAEQTFPSMAFVEGLAARDGRAWLSHGERVRPVQRPAPDAVPRSLPPMFAHVPNLLQVSDRVVAVEVYGPSAVLDAGGQPLVWLETVNTSNAICFDTGHVAVGSASGTTVWSPEGAQVATLPWHQHLVAAIPGSTSAIAAFDDHVHLLDVLTGASTLLPGTQGFYAEVVIPTGDGRHVLTLKTQRELLVWDRAGNLLAPVTFEHDAHLAVPTPDGFAVMFAGFAQRYRFDERSATWQSAPYIRPDGVSMHAFDGAYQGRMEGQVITVFDDQGKEVSRVDVGELEVRWHHFTSDDHLVVLTRDGRAFAFAL